ncbi:MAG: sialate O-acetylesterase, partial [bacterium]|nr:sialate O-acetylesterase [bacterium]
EAAPHFTRRFTEFIAAVRKDFGDPDLPFFQVQIGRVIGDWIPECWESIREQQRRIALEVPGVSLATAVDLSLDDCIHISTDDLKRLGKRLAHLACLKLYSREGQPGPQLCSISRENLGLRVVFSHVNGRLTCKGRLSGFAIVGADDRQRPAIFSQKVDPQDPGSVILQLTGGEPLPGDRVIYGPGLDPYCNLTDEADMAVPAFGPVEIP